MTGVLLGLVPKAKSIEFRAENELVALDTAPRFGLQRGKLASCVGGTDAVQIGGAAAVEVRDLHGGGT